MIKINDENIVYQNYHRHDMRGNIRMPDSTTTNRQYAERAVEIGGGIISSCNHGFQGRYIEGYELAEEFNLVFVFSVEAYWVKDRLEKDRTNSHIWIGAKNENGRQWINEILSTANDDGYYYQPRIDIELILSLPADDVIVTTACIAGWKYEDAEDVFRQFHKHFGSNFYIEVQPHNTASQIELTKRSLKFAKSEGIEIIAGCDSHYIHEDKAEERSEYLKSKGINYEDEYGWFLDYPDGNTFFQRFIDQGVLTEEEILKAINNTNIFLDIRPYETSWYNYEPKMPTIYPDLTKEEKDQLLKDIINKEWKQYRKTIDPTLKDVYLDEIRKEVDVIIKTNHSDYFLINYEIIKKGKELGGHITQSGRGSAGSFFVNTLLGFSTVDRIIATVTMYPERFMSETRILETKSLCDIDFNLSDDKPFIQAQRDIIGENHSEQMIAYGTMKESSAWKMYAKSQNVSIEIANDVSDQIHLYENAIRNADTEDEKALVDIYEYISQEYKDVYEKSTYYQGIISDFKPSPCSHLLLKDNIRREIGLIRVKSSSGKSTLCCIMDKDWSEKYKFLKNDLLIVKVVTLINMIYERLGMKPHTSNELINISNTDKEMWEIYAKGITLGVNQVEQIGTKRRAMKYKPTSVAELCAFVAGIRPGFKSMYTKFESRESFEYGIPSVDNLIQTKHFPYSFILYQEIQMALLNYSGIPMVECYEIIKNISKKKVDKVLAYKEIFLKGFYIIMIEDEHKTEKEAKKISESIWQILEDSARYSFNACVSGKTKIIREDTREKHELTVEEMFFIKNNKKYAKRHKKMMLHDEYNVSGYGQAFSMYEDNECKLNDIVDIYQSGIRETYKVTTADKSWLICTDNHKFPTVNGVKKLSDLKVGDELYTTNMSGINKPEYDFTDSGFEVCNKVILASTSKIESIVFIDEEMVYDIEMEHPAHNFITDSGLITCNSHSYCVAIDSMYNAYLKSHYPLVFYECFLELLEKNNEKNRIVAVRKEATQFYNISFPLPKFGQDNRKGVLDEKNNSITYTINSIKDFSLTTSEILYELGKNKYNSFYEILRDTVDTKINKKHLLPLINVEYFSAYGNVNQVTKIYKVSKLLKHGKTKSISKEKLIKFGDETLINIVARNGNATEKQYGKLNINAILQEYEEYVSCLTLPDYTRKERITIQLQTLGFMNISKYVDDEEARRDLVILEIYPVISKFGDNIGDVWAYTIKTQSIGSGKLGSFSIPIKVFSRQPLIKYDIIHADRVELNKKKTFWNMFEYHKI